MLHKRTGKRDGTLFQVFGAEPPERFDCYARQAVTKIDVTPSHITDLTIPKTRAEKKLEKY